MSTFGIDVSYWQDRPGSVLHWPAVTGVSFALARASIGLSRDPTYGYHHAGMLSQHLLPGAYHYLEPGGAAAQARLFLSAIRQADGLLCALDVEAAHLGWADVAGFYAEWHRHTSHPLLYYGNLSDTRAIVAGHTMPGPWWLAYYPGGGYPGDSSTLWSVRIGGARPTLWQYGPRREDGLLVDGDAFRGTLAQLATYAGGTSGQPNVDPDVKYANTSGYAPQSAKRVAAKAGTPLLYLDGTRCTAMSRDGVLTVLGRTDTGGYLVLVATGAPYADKVTRWTTLVLASSATLATVDPCDGVGQAAHDATKAAAIRAVEAIP